MVEIGNDPILWTFVIVCSLLLIATLYCLSMAFYHLLCATFAGRSFWKSYKHSIDMSYSLCKNSKQSQKNLEQTMLTTQILNTSMSNPTNL